MPAEHSATTPNAPIDLRAAESLGIPPHVASQGSAARRRAFRLAGRGIAAVRASLVETTCGLRVPDRSGPVGAAPTHPPWLYEGAVGPALALLAWGDAAGDGAAVASSIEIARGLAGSVSAATPQPGFYGGHGGVALLHLRLEGRVRGWSPAAEAARLLAPFHSADHREGELLYGAAGTGLALLQLHHRHSETDGDPAWLAAARRCGEWLGDHALRDARGIRWAWSPERDASREAIIATPGERFTGFAHGSAGIVHFLLALAAADRRGRAWRRLARDGARALDDAMRTTPAGTSWPVSDRLAEHWHHWCHGSTGIAQAYLSRWRHGDRRALGIACAAGDFTWTQLASSSAVAGRGELAGQCHGVAGAIECFLDLEAASGDPRWRRRAHALVRRIEGWAGPGDAPSQLGALGSGWANGVSGVVLALLRVAGHAVAAPHEVVQPAAHAPAPTRRRPRAPVVRDLPLTDEELLLLLPPVVAPLAGHPRRHLPVTDPPRHERLAYGRRLLASPDSAPLRAALAMLRLRLPVLERRYASCVAPGALAWTHHAEWLRELSGILLAEPRADVLAHRVAAARFVAEQHVSAVARLLAHVSLDLPTALAGRVRGPLVAAVPQGSDPHRGQQLVFRLTFADGREWAYKPRDVRADWWVCGATAWRGEASAPMRLNRALARAGSPVRVPMHEIIPVDAQRGYAEWLSAEPQPLESAAPRAFADAAHVGPVPDPRGLRLDDDDAARRFWHDAGALAACMRAFGVSDLHRENLRVGRAGRDRAASLHVVDAEVAFASILSMHETGLVPRARTDRDPAPRLEHTHEGLDVGQAAFCTMGAPRWGLVHGPDGLTPLGDRGAIGLRDLPNEVQNPDGSRGYGPWLCAMLRGMLDTWTVVGALEPALRRSMRARLRGVSVRVLARSTMVYAAPRMARLQGPEAPVEFVVREANPAMPFAPEELAQLDALDVPAFQRRLGEPGVWWRRNHPGRDAVAEVTPSLTPYDPPHEVVRNFATVSSLALALRDVVSFVAPEGRFDLRDDRMGVRVVRRRTRGPIVVVVLLASGKPAQFQFDPGGRVRSWGVAEPARRR